ncbi:unnamed protein product, partial [Closterium sp. Naga37s-1]
MAGIGGIGVIGGAAPLSEALVSSILPASLRALPAPALSPRCTGCALAAAALLLVASLLLALQTTLLHPAQQRDPVDSFDSLDRSSSQPSATWPWRWSPWAGGTLPSRPHAAVVEAEATTEESAGGGARGGRFGVVERNWGGEYWGRGFGAGSGGGAAAAVAAAGGRDESEMEDGTPRASVQAILFTFSSSWLASQGPSDHQAQRRGGGEEAGSAESSGNGSGDMGHGGGEGGSSSGGGSGGSERSSSDVDAHMSLELLQCLQRTSSPCPSSTPYCHFPSNDDRQWVEYWVRAGVQAVLWADVLSWEHVDPAHPTRDALAHMHAQKQALVRAYEGEGRVAFHREVMGVGSTRAHVVERVVAMAAHKTSAEWLLIADSPRAFLSPPSHPRAGFLSRFLAQQSEHVVQMRPSLSYLSSQPLLLPFTFSPRSLFSHAPVTDALLDPDEQEQGSAGDENGGGTDVEEGRADGDGGEMDRIHSEGQEMEGGESRMGEIRAEDLRRNEELPSAVTAAAAAGAGAANGGAPAAGSGAKAGMSTGKKNNPLMAVQHCFRPLASLAPMGARGVRGGGESLDGGVDGGMGEVTSGSEEEGQPTAVLVMAVRAGAVRALTPKRDVQHHRRRHDDYDDRDSADAHAAGAAGADGAAAGNRSALAHLLFSSPSDVTGKTAQQQQPVQQQAEAQQLVAVLLSAHSAGSSSNSSSGGRGDGMKAAVEAAGGACSDGWMDGTHPGGGLLEFQAAARAVFPRVRMQAARVAAAVVHGAVQRLQALVQRMQQQLNDAERAVEKRTNLSAIFASVLQPYSSAPLGAATADSTISTGSTARTNSSIDVPAPAAGAAGEGGSSVIFLAAMAYARVYREDRFNFSAYEIWQWLEYGRYAGVQHVFWYDTAHSQEESQEAALAPYVGAGVVTYHRFYRLFPEWHDIHYEQDSSVSHFLKTYGPRVQWAVLCDIDEYMFSPSDTLPGFLLRFLTRHVLPASNATAQ